MRAWNPRKAATRGAVYLDAVKPDWFRIINLSTLRLGSCTACVLGQCFGDYFAALEALVPWDRIHATPTIRGTFAVAFGFQAPEEWRLRGGYERLGLAWTTVIRARRRARRRHA